MTVKEKIELIDLDKIADTTSRAKVQAFINKVEAQAEANPDDAMNLIEGLIGKLILSNPQAIKTKISKEEAQKKVDKIKKMKNIVPQKADIDRIKAQISKQYPQWDDSKVEELAKIRIQAQIDRADSINKMIDNLEKTNLYAGKVSNAPIDYVAPKEPNRVMRSRNLPKDAKTRAITEADELRMTKKKYKRKSPTYGQAGGAKRPYYYEYRMNRRDVDNKIQLARGGNVGGVVVYDNGGESYDRYTVFTPDGSVFGMSENAEGFNMYLGDKTEIEMGSHLGKRLKSIPEGIAKAVKERMSEFAKGGSIELSIDDKIQAIVARVLDMWDYDDWAEIGVSEEEVDTLSLEELEQKIIEAFYLELQTDNSWDDEYRQLDFERRVDGTYYDMFGDDDILHFEEDEDDEEGDEEYAKGGSVSTSDLNALIAEINEKSGSKFYLGGAYGNYELWAKDDNGGDHRIEVGSRKDIREALIQNRYNKKFTKYAKGGNVQQFYVGQTISYPITKSTLLDKGVKNYFNKFADRELIIEEIIAEKPYNLAKVYDKESGEKISGHVVLNPKRLSKYAKGGNVSIPNSEKMMHLPMELAVYVPSTSNVDKEISASEMSARVKEVETYLAETFGGFTSSEKVGGYLSGKSGVITEKVVPVTAFATSESFAKNKAKLVNKLAVWAKKWSQEAMGLEFEGDLYYVPQKFKKGGRLTATYIPNDDIASITTIFGQTFKGKDILDGAYVKRKVKTPKVVRYMHEEEEYEYAKGGTVLPQGGQFRIEYCYATVTEDDYKHGEVGEYDERNLDFMVGMIFNPANLLDVLRENLGLTRQPSEYYIHDNAVMITRLEDSNGLEPTSHSIGWWKEGKIKLYSVHYTIGLQIVVVSETTDEMLSALTNIKID